MRKFIHITLLILFSAIASLAIAEQSIVGNVPEKVNVSEKKVKKILRRNGFSRVKIIEIDYEFFENKKIYEVDFKYKGKLYEAGISLEYQFIYSEIDIDD